MWRVLWLILNIKKIGLEPKIDICLTSKGAHEITKKKTNYFCFSKPVIFVFPAWLNIPFFHTYFLFSIKTPDFLLKHSFSEQSNNSAESSPLPQYFFPLSNLLDFFALPPSIHSIFYLNFPSKLSQTIQPGAGLSNPYENCSSNGACSCTHHVNLTFK